MTVTIGSDYGTSYGAAAGFSMGSVIVSLAISVLVIVAMWKLFVKAGKPGWTAIVPFYNMYTAFDMVYGNGLKFLFLLIPFYNIYVGIKFYIDFAKVFGKSAGFGIGLIFLSPIFMCVLAFSDARYLGVKGRPVAQSYSAPKSDEDAKAALKAKLQARK